ncbi:MULTISPECIES: hypothetical protein [Streptacidiphilus]|uniref:Type II toxin-antitoxin system Phd/YefM family antitoxin n=1 Tax=Streptacidiphilus cavernicola TaxID=3342716 RepID=A0ABV6UX93_9ACTN|nr:hypothetical protein [Streptacidiphilus jeojiense]
MSRQPEPERIFRDGEELVLLTVEQYESLRASRRQIGGQANRVRRLRQDLDVTRALLDTAVVLLGELDSCPDVRHRTCGHRDRAASLRAVCSPGRGLTTRSEEPTPEGRGSAERD